jgi:hypothetical protein
MYCTCNDLCYVITVLSTHLTNQNDELCVTLKHVLRYLKRSFDYELCFRKSNDGLKWTDYSNTSWDQLTTVKALLDIVQSEQ